MMMSTSLLTQRCILNRCSDGRKVQNGDHTLGSSMHAARRLSQIGASTSYGQPETLAPIHLYRQLEDAAKQGAVREAEELIHIMEDAGHTPDASAFHSLIFSQTKAGDSEAAYTTLKAVRETGLEPAAESYAVAIYSCLMTDLHVRVDEPPALGSTGFEITEGLDYLDLDLTPDEPLPDSETEWLPAADRVLSWLMNAPVDRQPGWASYLRGLVNQGLAEEDDEAQLEVIGSIEGHLAVGRLEGWYPDLDLYEDILGLFCEDPKKATIAEKILWEDLVMREGVEPETRHYNCMLRAEAIFTGLNVARKMLQDMTEGKLGRHIRPDIETFNSLLEGCLMERIAGFSYAVEDMEEMVAEIVTVGLKMNKRTHTLLMMFYIVENQTDKVLFEMREAEKLAAPGRYTEQLSDEWLDRLIMYLLEVGCVIEVFRILYMMMDDARALPVQTCMLDDHGQTISTQWLPSFLNGQHFFRRTQGLEKYAVAENDDDAYQVEGSTWMNSDNSVVDAESGLTKQPGSMTVEQLRSELDAKGLSIAGTKNDLTRRIQQSRGNQPISVRVMMRRQEADIQARKARSSEKQAETTLRQGMKVMQKSVELIDHMKARDRYVETFVVEPSNSESSKDEDHFEHLYSLNMPENVTAMMKMYRAYFNNKDLDTLYYLNRKVWNTDDPEFRKLNPHFEGRPGFGEKLQWPEWGNGARLAFFMMDVAQKLGAGASVNDFLQLNEACVLEGDAELSVALLQKLRPYNNTLDTDLLRQVYTKSLVVCLEKQELALAGVVASTMKELDLQPLGSLNQPSVLDSISLLASNEIQSLAYLDSASGNIIEPGVDQDLEQEADLVKPSEDNAGANDKESATLALDTLNDLANDSSIAD